MITFVELAERIEQLEKRVQILESQISGDSPNQKKSNNDLNQFNLTESNIEENIDVFDNSYFYDTDFSKNDLPDNSVDDFTFCEVFGGIEVSSYNGFADNDTIIVPRLFYNQPVVSIGEAAFEGVSAKVIYLPDSIINIKAKAFRNCKNLKYIKLQEGLNEIGESTFDYCESMNKVDLPKSITKLGRCCFSRSAIEQIVLPPKLEIVPVACFERCKELSEVSMSEGILNIESYAFSETAIKNIIIPASVKNIKNKALDSSSKNQVDIVFLGMETVVECSSSWWNGICMAEPTIYCKAGSALQKIARKCGCVVKPLSEFQE